MSCNAQFLENEVAFLQKDELHDEILADDGQLFTPELKKDIKTTQRYMLDLLIMLVAPTVIAVYYYGSRALALLATSVLTAVLAEYIGGKLLKNFPTPRDLSAVVTGVCLALCLPASAPLWMAVLGASFAILIAKLPFGNVRSSLFSPAAAGLCFLAVCFPEIFFTYPVIGHPEAAVSVYGTVGFTPGVSLASMLSASTALGDDAAHYITVLLGNFAGPMGTTCIIALLGALLYVAIRRFKSFEVTASFLLTAAIYAFCFPRITAGRFQSVFMELFSGMLLFAAIFLLPNEFFMPRRFYGRILYGVVAGLGTMILRTFGAFEEGVMFVVLLMSVIAPMFNKLPLTKFEKKKLAVARKKRREQAERLEHEAWFKESETEIAPAVPDVPQEEPTEQPAPKQNFEEQILEAQDADEETAAPQVEESNEAQPEEGGAQDV